MNKALTKLGLSKCGLETLEGLSKNYTLKWLNISGNHLLDFDWVKSSLTHLDVSNNFKFSDECLEQVIRSNQCL